MQLTRPVYQPEIVGLRTDEPSAQALLAQAERRLRRIGWDTETSWAARIDEGIDGPVFVGPVHGSFTVLRPTPKP